MTTRPASLSQSTRETNTRTAARISKEHGIPAETALRDTARKRAKPEGDRMSVGDDG